MAQQYLGLSLFVILLCFFIVLNSVSSFEVIKTQGVVQSLQVAFAGKTEGESNLPSMRMTPTETFNKGTALDQIKALFQAQIKTFKASTNRMGTEMMVRLPLAEFEETLKSAAAAGIASDKALSPRDGKFLPMLISLIDTTQTAVPYRMDIALNIPENPASLGGGDPARFKALMQQTSGFSNTLELAGMPRKLVSAGLMQGRAEDAFDADTQGVYSPYVELYFRRYLPIDPLGGQSMGAQE